MANTASETIPASQAQVESAALSTSATPQATDRSEPKKFDHVQRAVGAKAKAFLNLFHSAGEHIRGNINAALDGAGDAIAGRKTGEVTGRKSGEAFNRRSMPPPATTSVSASSAPAPVPATRTMAPNDNVESEQVTTSQEEQADGKRFPVGKYVNNSLKRTITLVHRVGSTLRSKGTQTADSLGNTLSEGKQRASRRFSRAPKSDPASAEQPASVAVDPSSATPQTQANVTNTPPGPAQAPETNA